MTVGGEPDVIGRRLLRGRHHGVLVSLVGETDSAVMSVDPAFTKRGARRAFLDWERRLVDGRYLLTTVGDVRMLAVRRVESGRVVAERTIPLPPDSDDPLSGVREPRRPTPSGGEATAFADREDG